MAVAYGSGIYYSSLNEDFQTQFVKYVPLAGTIIDYLEEREVEKIGARINSSIHKINVPKPSFISALEHRSSSSSLTSRMTEELTEEEKIESSKTSNSSATSATSSKDPLTPKHFFDAVSGTVGDETRDYLPLVLLPDDRDEVLNKAVMSLNDLIASYNASTIQEDTMLSVSLSLAKVAQNNESIAPHYAQVIMYKAEKFDSLYQSYRCMYEEYLNTQEQIAGDISPIKANPVLADYNKRIADEITDTEMLLVKLVNSGKGGHDLETTDTEYKRYKASITSNKKKAKASIPQHATASSLFPKATSSAVPSSSISYGAFDGSDVSLRLELALTLLVGALQQHTPIASYIEGVREAVSQYPDVKIRENVINEALKSITVPDSVDLQPVLQDILTYDSKNHW